jgi:pyrroline-5-carboxylate reductase
MSGDCNAPNTEIYIQKAGTKSQAGTATTLSQTATFVNGATTIWLTAAVTGEIQPGEKVFNSTDDNVNYAVAVQSVGATYIYLWTNYLGTAGNAKAISVSSAASFASWVQPTTSGSADALSFSDLAQNEYFGIWEKRVVTAGGAGMNNATYSLSVTDT